MRNKDEILCDVITMLDCVKEDNPIKEGIPGENREMLTQYIKEYVAVINKEKKSSQGLNDLKNELKKLMQKKVETHPEALEALDGINRDIQRVRDKISLEQLKLDGS